MSTFFYISVQSGKVTRVLYIFIRNIFYCILLKGYRCFTALHFTEGISLFLLYYIYI